MQLQVVEYSKSTLPLTAPRAVDVRVKGFGKN